MTEGKKYKIGRTGRARKCHNRYAVKVGELDRRSNRYNAKSRDRCGRGSWFARPGTPPTAGRGSGSG